MNTIFESRNDYMIVKPSEYVTCPKSGHQFYKQHKVCDCK